MFLYVSVITNLHRWSEVAINKRTIWEWFQFAYIREDFVENLLGLLIGTILSQSKLWPYILRLGGRMDYIGSLATVSWVHFLRIWWFQKRTNICLKWRWSKTLCLQKKQLHSFLSCKCLSQTGDRQTHCNFQIHQPLKDL